MIDKGRDNDRQKTETHMEWSKKYGQVDRNTEGHIKGQREGQKKNRRGQTDRQTKSN